MFMKFALLLSFNRNYFEYAQVCIYSFIKNNEWFKNENHSIILINSNNWEEFEKYRFLKLYNNILFYTYSLDESNKWCMLQNFWLEKCQFKFDGYNNFNGLFNKFAFMDFLDKYDGILTIDCDMIVNNSLEYIFKSNYQIAVNLTYCASNVQKLNLTQFGYNYNDTYSYNDLVDHQISTSILYASKKSSSIFNYFCLYEFIDKICNVDLFAPSGMNLEEAFLNWYLRKDFILYNDLSVLSKITFLPVKSQLFLVKSTWFNNLFNEYNLCNNFSKNEFEEIKKYDIIHYIIKPHSKDANFNSSAFQYYFYYYQQTLSQLFE